MKPIIGIVGTPFEETEDVKLGYAGQQTGTRTTYEDAIFKSDAISIVLCPTNNIDIINQQLNLIDGLLMQGGSGDIEGVHMLYIKEALKKDIPILGICLGMQCAVVEFARNVLGYADANSTEMSRTTTNPVIDLMEEQKGVTEKGGTMRLGAYPCDLKTDTKVFGIYKQEHIIERHRHRYEFNNSYLNEFEKAGLKAVGLNPDTNLVEIVEIPEHRWFIGVQFHPEYKSTVVHPHPLFVDFVREMCSCK